MRVLPRASRRLQAFPRATLVAIVGGFATFSLMAGAELTAELGSIAFAPWIALVGFDVGALAGVAASVAATGLWVWASTLDAGAPAATGPQVAIRLAIFASLGASAGVVARRLHRSEAAQRSIASLQSDLIDATLDGICLTDEQGEILISNAPLRRIAVELGLPPTGTVSDRLIAIAERTTEPHRYRERMLELARDPHTETADEFELKGSGRVFRGYTAPVVEPDGSFAGRVWTLREVTADRELERLRDAFVAAVSHELRTPLTSISGFLEMLADEEAELGETGRRYLSIIRRSTVRLQRIVEDLLLVAQIEAQRLELRYGPADLAELAAACVEAARPAADEKGVLLELHRDGPLPLEADGQRLAQVLDNLVTNAIKFTEEGGRVVVAVTREGSGSVVTVSDTGIGIPPDEVDQLFSRFYRASSARRRAIPGTGLGLVIAQAIVEAHGGTITLQSREGEGTSVSVALPTRPAQRAGAV
ncbi:MAG TPA: ATP-binding protein [Gaiellaceae bacterium]|nr:ATP-binding protein [Gaiellaceae bacterium]